MYLGSGRSILWLLLLFQPTQCPWATPAPAPLQISYMRQEKVQTSNRFSIEFCQELAILSQKKEKEEKWLSDDTFIFEGMEAIEESKVSGMKGCRYACELFQGCKRVNEKCTDSVLSTMRYISQQEWLNKINSIIKNHGSYIN